MSNIKQLMNTLEALDISVRVEGGQLKLRAPKGALTPALQAQIKATKSALILHLQTAADVGHTIPATSRDGSSNVSFGQQRLWILEQFDPGKPVYNIAQALRLEGPLDIKALQQTLSTILERHEALRTRFKEDNGRPVQIVENQFDLPLSQIDLSDAPTTDLDDTLTHRMREEARIPFSLTEAPLIRAILYRLADQSHVLLIVVHHIAFDGWSFAVLYHEISSLYNSALQGAGASLVELPVQYRDFAEWQLRSMSGEVLEKQLHYWTTALENNPTSLTLPTDRPRPPQQTFRGATLHRRLEGPLLQSLTSLAQTHGATLFMVGLAAFQILMSRYSSQTNIAVGTPVAGRDHVDIENLLGFFVNSVVMQSDLDGNPTFVEFLHQVRKTVLEALDHQETPFDRLVDAIKPERDMSRSPLFQVMFVLQNTPPAAVSMDGLEVRSKAVPLETSKFDLTLSIESGKDSLVAAWEYATDLFDHATITRMAEHYEVLLTEIAKNPDAPVMQIPLLDDASVRKQVVDWNQTEKQYPETRCLQDLLDAQCEQTPDATAVVFEDTALSYAQLNARANQLAAWLREQNVGPDSLVGICIDRSLEMVIGLLGIIKAGGAYVPLDPTYPQDRLAYMIEHSQAPVVLTQESLRTELPTTDATLLALDSEWDQLDVLPQDNPSIVNTPDDLAYVIYTSGSTGQPKGVMVPHRGICNRLQWMQEMYSLDTSDRVLQKTSFSFDVSVWEFFWPLISGATLVVARPEGHKDTGYLTQVIADQAITTLHFVPSMLQLFLEDPKVDQCTTLRRVICSGEALPFDTQQRFFSRLDAELHNLYGPTEASIDVTYWTCERNPSSHRVPIGYPIANTQIYILDRYQQPVPIGVSGELHIAGVGLARGYLHNDALTRDTFIANPFSKDVHAKMYKSGDLARYRADGSIEYSGRLDHQIKLRGYRIELGEIEACLDRHPDLRDTAVLPYERGPGDTVLVAYYVRANDNEPSNNDLRQHLEQSLPDYMVPSVFIRLAEFPLTANGKFDRKNLPAPDFQSTSTNGSDEDWLANYQSPRDALEYQLSEIWEELFTFTRPISIDEDFFALGGHSLAAVRLMNQVNRVTGQNLPLATLFQAPTIETLAQRIKDSDSSAFSSDAASLVTIKEGGGNPVFVLPLADGIIFHIHLRLGRYLAADSTVYGLQARGVQGKEHPHESMEDAAAEYIQLMREVQPHGPYKIIGICDGATTAFEIAQQLTAQNETVGCLCMIVPTLPPLQKVMHNPPKELYRALKNHPPELGRVANAHFKSRGLYIPATYPGSIVLFEGEQDPPQRNAQVRQRWAELIDGELTHHIVPGDHNTCVQDPNVQILAAKLAHYILKPPA
ncbi:MAG TPA: amino acid adenylation domain-containing protein [Chromatiales bacterium]|nr:amino acid adenylation domain-containing protein [Chromatiales bacterium]